MSKQMFLWDVEPESDELLRDGLSGLKVSRAELLEGEKDEVWGRIEGELGIGGKGRKDISWVRYVVVAFVSILIMILGSLFFDSVEKKVVTVVQNIAWNKNGVEKILLSDGSVVWMKGRSKFSWPAIFHGNKRVVTLKGSSFFNIREDRLRPFVVYTDRMTILVKGTSFFVQEETDSTTAVTLLSGGVTIDIRDAQGDIYSTCYLKPGQQVDYDRIGDGIIISKVDTTVYIAVRDGGYRFINEPMEKIARYIEICFDKKTTLSPALKERCFTGYFREDQTLEEILDILTKSHSLLYQMENGVIHIREK